MAMSILFGTTSMLAVTITFERKGRSFERLLLAPISLGAMVAAKLSGAILFGVFNAFVPLIFAAFFIDLTGIGWGTVLLAVLLIAVTSTLMGLMIAVSAKEVFEAQTLSNFFRFPMLFLCGLFLPVSSLPDFLRPLSYLLPLTYGTDMLSGAIIGRSMLSPVVCTLYCLSLQQCCLPSVITISAESGLFNKDKMQVPAPGSAGGRNRLFLFKLRHGLLISFSLRAQYIANRPEGDKRDYPSKAHRFLC